jgi:hypothetical protein
MKLQDEIDNHADTCCFGANFTPLYFTGQVCDVSPFTRYIWCATKYRSLHCLTGMGSSENGRHVHTRIPWGLWFGEKLPQIHWLIQIKVKIRNITMWWSIWSFSEMEAEGRNRTDYTIIHVWNDMLFWFKVPKENSTTVHIYNDKRWFGDPTSLRIGHNSSEEEYNRLVQR